MKALQLIPHNKDIKGAVELPASKSISNRALICNFLGNNSRPVFNLSEAKDTQILLALLNLVQDNVGSEEATILHCGNAGTTYRFLTAALSITPGKWLLQGSQQMEERPVKPLVDGLISLGADITYQGKEGFPPLIINGKSLKGGKATVKANTSSQFISALLMIAPRLKNGLELKLSDEIVSEPYISLTLWVLKKFGVQTTTHKNVISITNQKFKANSFEVEADWSSAAFWYELASMTQTPEILIRDLKEGSKQGDAVLPDIYSDFGIKSTFLNEGLLLTRQSKVKSHFHYDFKDHPDLFQAVVASCAGNNIPAGFEGLHNLRIKETDRLSAMQNELQKLGYLLKFNLTNTAEKGVLEKDQEFINHAESQVSISTYDDHRMAMALAPLAFKFPGLIIRDPEVVSKSYPGFWQNLASFFQLQKL